MKPALIPAYGQGALSDLLPSIGSHLGMPNSTDRLHLPDAERYLVLLVDGLGAELLAAHAAEAPYLSSLEPRTITAGAPTTTASSITSLGTGLAPGAHGIAGYSFWYPEQQAVLNTLRWPAGLSGLDVQPQLTYFERLAKAGIGTGTIAPARFAGSGLTTVALRDPNFWPVHDETDAARRVELSVAATSVGDRNLSYCYERALDHAGHANGVDSVQWRHELSRADELARTLRQALPDTVRLVVTGDHGMLDVPAGARVLLEDEPELSRDVVVFAGEGRFRHLVTTPGTAEEVAERWRDRLAERAWVRTREEAVSAGWFGDISPRFASRFGDVIVAMADDGAILSRKLPEELKLIGMHGSLTSAELVVPLLID
jgi:predicted AlkP superfamily pyrophosphatase or phosphodiesterase